jgi:hypothetical protein
LFSLPLSSGCHTIGEPHHPQFFSELKTIGFLQHHNICRRLVLQHLHWLDAPSSVHGDCQTLPLTVLKST